MERCFVIEKSAKIHKAYFDYLNLRNENNQAIKKFVSEHIAEDKKDYMFYDGSNFGITLTAEEYEKFKTQVKVYYTLTEQGRLYSFKKNSTVGKAWAALKLKPARKPIASMEFMSILSSRSRLFNYENNLYCSIDSDDMTKETKTPENWREISKSEFYALIDKIEQEEK